MIDLKVLRDQATVNISCETGVNWNRFVVEASFCDLSVKRVLPSPSQFYRLEREVDGALESLARKLEDLTEKTARLVLVDQSMLHSIAKAAG